MLLEAGASPNKKNAEGFDPLAYATDEQRAILAPLFESTCSLHFLLFHFFLANPMVPILSLEATKEFLEKKKERERELRKKCEDLIDFPLG